VAREDIWLEEQMETLRRGAAEIISEDELRDKLRRARAEGRPLRVKLGVDPSAPDIHLGHTVVLRKLRRFQDLGHEVIFLIGDFTGRVGDPTGRSQTRPQLTEEQVLANARTYKEQVFKVLDPDRTVVEFNSKWLAAMSFGDVVRLASTYTVARMLERDDYAARFEGGVPIYVHEFFYPLMQGYDSVALRADVELGGTEQKFNIMVARHIQREYGVEPEVCLLMPILEGVDGRQRMSKSIGNYIGIDEPPQDIFGKTMSIPDEIICRYLELVTDVPLAEIERLRRGMESGEVNPRDAKARLAREIVAMYHGAGAAAAAEAEFDRIFRRGGNPGEMPEVAVPAAEVEDGRVRIVRLLVILGLADSNSEARRLVRQGAVRIDGGRITDEGAAVPVAPGTVVQAGKRRFARVK